MIKKIEEFKNLDQSFRLINTNSMYGYIVPFHVYKFYFSEHKLSPIFALVLSGPRMFSNFINITVYE